MDAGEHERDEEGERGAADPVARLLARVRTGDADAAGELFELVYGELRQRAQGLLAGQGPQTLQATALVHEAWLKLHGPMTRGTDGSASRDRGHFLAVAAKAMRSVLIDHARAKATLKRGEGRVLLDEALEAFGEHVPNMLELDEELERLSELDPTLAELVELRFFGGLTVDEVAAVQGSNRSAVERGWRTARAWLAGRLTPPAEG